MTDNQLKKDFRKRIKKLIENHQGTWVTIADNRLKRSIRNTHIFGDKIYLPNPKMTTLIKLSEYFDVELSWLILGDSDE